MSNATMPVITLGQAVDIGDVSATLIGWTAGTDANIDTDNRVIRNFTCN